MSLHVPRCPHRLSPPVPVVGTLPLRTRSHPSTQLSSVDSPSLLFLVGPSLLSFTISAPSTFPYPRPVSGTPSPRLSPQFYFPSPSVSGPVYSLVPNHLVSILKPEVGVSSPPDDSKKFRYHTVSLNRKKKKFLRNCWNTSFLTSLRFPQHLSG